MIIYARIELYKNVQEFVIKMARVILRLNAGQ